MGPLRSSPEHARAGAQRLANDSCGVRKKIGMTVGDPFDLPPGETPGFTITNIFPKPSHTETYTLGDGKYSSVSNSSLSRMDFLTFGKNVSKWSGRVKWVAICSIPITNGGGLAVATYASRIEMGADIVQAVIDPSLANVSTAVVDGLQIPAAASIGTALSDSKFASPGVAQGIGTVLMEATRRLRHRDH